MISASCFLYVTLSPILNGCDCFSSSSSSFLLFALLSYYLCLHHLPEVDVVQRWLLALYKMNIGWIYNFNLNHSNTFIFMISASWFSYITITNIESFDMSLFCNRTIISVITSIITMTIILFIRCSTI